MAVPRLGLGSWHTIVLGLALELAFENAGLVYVSVVTERRWSERVLVIVPLATFVWMMGIARGIQIQVNYWSSNFAFIAANYPDTTLLYAQTRQEFQHVVDGANSLGWTAMLVTEAMVLFGGILLLRWGSAVGWWGRRRDSTPPAPMTVMPSEDDDDAGELEITIEPLNRMRHD